MEMSPGRHAAIIQQDRHSENRFGSEAIVAATAASVSPARARVRDAAAPEGRGSGLHGQRKAEGPRGEGAIVAFTRSLSLAEKMIRVNGVASGPIWPPLIPSTFPAEHVE